MRPARIAGLVLVNAAGALALLTLYYVSQGSEAAMIGIFAIPLAALGWIFVYAGRRPSGSPRRPRHPPT